MPEIVGYPGMRIVHVADSFAPDVGGIESQVEALARQQTADGHDVSVITAVGDDADLPLDVHRGLRTRWLTVAFPWLNHRMVAEVLNDRQIDVVHAHFTVISPIAIYVVRAASKRGIPVAVTVHSVWWKVAIATRVSSMAFFGPSRMRAVYSGVSSMVAGHIARTLPKAGPVSVLPNLVDVQWWAPHGPTRATATPVLRLMLVGRLKKRKHIDGFIDILARARALVPADTRVQVDIVGEGPRRDDLQEQIGRLGLTDWVTLLGHRDPTQIRDLLHACDLFVAPSRQEAFGIAALEARGAGVPVVGYSYTGVADFIEHDVEGLLVADEVDLVTTLAKLFVDHSHVDALRRSTRDRPASVTRADAMAATYRLYRRAQAMYPGRKQTLAPED
ncbi:glycosyltransferase family 4 protein [Leekyejoonella antrihumi]|uniref:D-inositol 3-phosphate glycosyltransferase n=1 Tax=Leekyejoonella antrihumi TaxID=1660198 RepID=A0A563E1P7_9MICO|nr:glycosyltransferase family 4 protein [Leekyejoonella antrihumi]TWP36470.1 glycosyltransferase family 4 protein [Leekyejoonella antrihumi]